MREPQKRIHARWTSVAPVVGMPPCSWIIFGAVSDTNVDDIVTEDV